MTRFGLAGWACVALLSMGPATALAADAKGEFVLRGIGGQSCETGLAMIKTDKHNAADLASWITGYVTALNRVSPGTYDLVPLNDVTALVRIVGGMCAANPKASMESIVVRMIQQLSVARVHDASPMVEAESGGKTVAVRQATLAAMQSKLIEAKLFKGPADGQFGDKTASALKKYQKQQKLAETGLPDAATVVHLLVEPGAKPAAEPEEKSKKEKKKKR